MIPNYLTLAQNNQTQQAPQQPDQNPDQVSMHPPAENFYPIQNLINNNIQQRSETPDKSSNFTIINPTADSNLTLKNNNNIGYNHINRIPNIQAFSPYQYFPPQSITPPPPPSPSINPPNLMTQKKARFNRIQNINPVNIHGTAPISNAAKKYHSLITPTVLPILSNAPKSPTVSAQVISTPQPIGINPLSVISTAPNNSALLLGQYPMQAQVLPYDSSHTGGNGIILAPTKPILPILQQNVPLSSHSTGEVPLSSHSVKSVPSVNKHRLPVPEIQIPKETETEIPSQSPSYFRDPEAGDYGVHCVCGKSHTDGLLLQCENCELWLHGMCVNVPRPQSDPYFCPFCRGQRIRCPCESNIYSIPLIQCSKCQFWFHKECQELFFGVVPKTFVCTKCNGVSHNFYEFPRVTFDEDFPDKIVATDEVRQSKILEGIPEGNLRTEIMTDLNYPELEFKSTIEKYYQKFAVLLFDGPHEFWKVFINSLCSLLVCEKNQVLDAIDHLTTKFLYTNSLVPMSNVKFGHSDSITEQLEQKIMPRFEKQPDNVPIYIDENDGRVKTSSPIDDGAFIIDLPGFIMRTDDVNADKGIPKSCLVITNSEIVVDMNGTPFCKYATSIRRSFHFNAIAKLIRVKGEAIAALFATRTKGPLSEEKNRRGPAIPEGGEIILPFDGEIPYNVQKIEWKEKKARYSANSSGKNKATFAFQNESVGYNSADGQNDKVADEASKSLQNREDGLIDDEDEEDELGESQNANGRGEGNSSWQNKKKERKVDRRKKKQRNQKSRNQTNKERNKNVESNMDLTLLSSFMSDVVPPMPIVLLPDQNAVDKYKMLQMVKSHSRHS